MIIESDVILKGRNSNGFKKMYNIINIVGGIMCVILIAFLFVFKDQKIKIKGE